MYLAIELAARARTSGCERRKRETRKFRLPMLSAWREEASVEGLDSQHVVDANVVLDEVEVNASNPNQLLPLSQVRRAFNSHVLCADVHPSLHSSAAGSAASTAYTILSGVVVAANTASRASRSAPTHAQR
jgi:hypothetical protein